MSLSHKFDKLKDNSDSESARQPSSETEKLVEQYDSPGHPRNLCFIEAGGKRTFLNYAYLVTGEYSPEQTAITLSFTTHTVTLKGANLDILFEYLLDHKVKKITSLDKRYQATTSDSEIVVSELLIEKIN